LRIPEPRAEHLPALAKNLATEVAAERGISAEWYAPGLDGDEMELAGRLWKGGSIRRLRNVIEIILSRRDQLAMRH
jgi:ATP-dependent Lon protease